VENDYFNKYLEGQTLIDYFKEDLGINEKTEKRKNNI